MEYIFRPATELLLRTGALQQVVSKTGQLLPIARDPGTGKFVEIARTVVLDGGGFSLQPFIAPIQAATGIAHMVQTHRGFTAVLGQLSAIQSTLGVLQATTALIGVGTVAVGALSAVNLWQTLKLRQDVKELRLEVRDGFLDLKQALRDQGAEILQRIDALPQEIEFRAHRQALVQAYGRFLTASERIKVAVYLEDITTRNMELVSIREVLSNALADYRNPALLQDLGAAGQLRRLECAWAIDHAIALTYQLQDEPTALSDHLAKLQGKIQQDILGVIRLCQHEEEIDFLFPEIQRIHDHDLAALKSWQAQVDWVQLLPASELKLLQSADFSNLETVEDLEVELDLVTVPREQIVYESLKQTSPPRSLLNQLQFMMKPELRQAPETYISQKAMIAGHTSLVPDNLRQMSGMALANLYWYFKIHDGEEVNLDARIGSGAS